MRGALTALLLLTAACGHVRRTASCTSYVNEEEARVAEAALSHVLGLHRVFLVQELGRPSDMYSMGRTEQSREYVLSMGKGHLEGLSANAFDDMVARLHSPTCLPGTLQEQRSFEFVAADQGRDLAYAKAIEHNPDFYAFAGASPVGFDREHQNAAVYVWYYKGVEFAGGFVVAARKQGQDWAVVGSRMLWVA